MAGPSEDNLTVEVREEEMISPLNGVSSLRIAHFLRPSVTSVDGPVFDPPLDSVNPNMIDNSVPLKAIFVGWRQPQKDWKTWVNRMQSLHHSTWKQAGIHDAIMNSTFEIPRNADLILGVVEKWCSKTNTFVFPWGEATITLEDIMVLGCFSVLGDSVLSPTGDLELEMIIDKLQRARSDINQSKAKKACQSAWMIKFMNCGSKIELEAFLAYWLSRFVFPIYDSATIGRTVLPIAVRLARGTKIALAPAVLASIYKNLSSLKGALVASRKLGTRKGKVVPEVKITAPFQLVQAWVWERFPTLRPKPNSAELGEPRLARWHGLKKVVNEKVVLAIDCAAKDFIWRPYMRAENNTLPHMVYKEKDYWLLVDSCLGDEFEGLVRCLRSSELVSLEVGCIEQYLPHRVAMQFGMDQDLPGCVARVNESSTIAWRNYTREIGDTILYIPPRLFESSVTTRYLKWWNNLSFVGNGTTKAGLDGKTTSKGFKRQEMEDFFKMKSVDDALAPPPGFPPKSNSLKAGVSGNKDKDTVGKKIHDESNGISLPRKDPQRKSTSSSADNGTKADFHGNGTSESSKGKLMESLSVTKSDKDALVPPPPGFSPKRARVEADYFGVKDKKTGAELLEGGSNENKSVGHAKSCCRNTLEAPGMGLEERICTIEKLCAWLKAGNRHLDDIKLRKRAT